MRQNGTKADEEDGRGMLSLVLENIWLRIQLAFLRWRLRRRGINPDTLPEMDEWRREREDELAKIKCEDQRKRMVD